jgi:hypothetical protein
MDQVQDVTGRATKTIEAMNDELITSQPTSVSFLI